jgi:hypothetical protein
VSSSARRAARRCRIARSGRHIGQAETATGNRCSPARIDPVYFFFAAFVTAFAAAGFREVV